MKNLLGLLAILVIAVFVRLASLSLLPNGLHWDEMDTGFQAWSLYSTGRDYFGNELPLLIHSIADYRTPVFIYSAVPAIKFFGLSAFSVRIISVIYGTLSVFLIYLLSRQVFADKKLSWFAALTLALSPWGILYSRQSVECNAMLTFLLLGLVTFYKSLTRHSWTWVSFLSFGLAVASYSPAKMFIPILVLFLFLQHYGKQLVQYNFDFVRRFILPGFMFLIIAGPIIYDGSFGKSALRFHDVSIFTDPQVGSGVNLDRQKSLVGSGQAKAPDSGTRLIDKYMFNKPSSFMNVFFENYLGIFSPQYLFLEGDSELRHSPGRDTIGQFHLIEIITLLLGFVALVSRRHITSASALLLLVWFLVGAIPSSLTRGGGPHAARTFLMLPAFILAITLGAKFLFSKSRFLFAAYLLGFVGSSIWFLGYFFNTYRLESAVPFHWGFDQVIALAQTESPKYDHVILDLHQNSGLMAYLFYSGITPAEFQATYPLPVVDFVPEVSGNSMGNIILLFPGSRLWSDIFNSGHYQGHNLIISSADQRLLDQLKHLSVIKYPDSSPAYYSFTKN